MDVPLIDETTCENDFANEPFVTQIAGLTLFCAGDDSDETNVNNEDSCSGDSGGPIVIDPNQTAPHTDVQLAGLVDSGFGCAQAHLPGIYTRISDPSIQTFLASDPPGAPRQLSSVSIAGGNQPGQRLTCHSDPWTDPDATLAYQFFTTSGSALTSPSAEGTTYTIQQGDVGKRIQCEVEATNAGGYGFAHSSSVLVAAPAPPVTPPGAVDSVAPRLRVTSKSCSQTACTIRVKVTDAAPSSGIAKVKARLNYARKVSCRKHGKKTTCTKRAHRTLRPRRGKGGKFTIVAKRLKPGTGYSVSLVPFDKAGNKPEFSTITSIRTKPRHRRGSLF